VQLLDRLAGDLVGWSIGFIAEEDSILHSATPVLSCTHHLLILPLISVADCLSSPTCAFCPPTYLIDSEVDSALKISFNALDENQSMSAESFYQPLYIMNSKASTGASRPAAGKDQVLSVRKRPPRRQKKVWGSVDEFVQTLHQLYRRECDLFCPSVAWLAREADIPYETLRHFLTDSEHMLCPVNEEKLARALGRSSSYFRRVVERWKRFRAWKQKALAARCR